MPRPTEAAHTCNGCAHLALPPGITCDGCVNNSEYKLDPGLADGKRRVVTTVPGPTEPTNAPPVEHISFPKDGGLGDDDNLVKEKKD